MSKRKQIPSDVMRELQGLPAKPEPTKPLLLPEEPQPQPKAVAPAPPTTAPASSRQKKRVTPKKRLINRVTYEIGAELKGVIHEEAVRLGVPDSQLAKYLLLFAWDFYLNETISEPQLIESTSPKYRNSINFD